MSVNKAYSGIRVRKSIQNCKNRNKLMFLQNVESSELKKQLSYKLNQEDLHLPSFKTQLMITSKRIDIPSQMINTGRNYFSIQRNSPRGKTVTGKKQKTTHFDSCQYLDDKKPSFGCRKVSYGLSPLKGSFSSVMAPKTQPYRYDRVQSVKNMQEFKENEISKINFQSTKLMETKSTRKGREDRCLIAVTRKLPFSLQRRNTKIKCTQKTHFTSTAEDLFDLDISTIIDENEPLTPFVRRGSQLDSIINMANMA